MCSWLKINGLTKVSANTVIVIVICTVPVLVKKILVLNYSNIYLECNGLEFKMSSHLRTWGAPIVNIKTENMGTIVTIRYSLNTDGSI